MCSCSVLSSQLASSEVQLLKKLQVWIFHVQAGSYQDNSTWDFWLRYPCSYHIKKSFACWITGQIWNTLVCKLLLTKYHVWSWAVAPGHGSDSPPLQTCRETYPSRCVSVCRNPYFASALSGVGRVFWCLHSTRYPLECIWIVAFHKENKPLKSGVGRSQQGSSLTALKPPGPKITGLDWGWDEAPSNRPQQASNPSCRGSRRRQQPLLVF